MLHLYTSSQAICQTQRERERENSLTSCGFRKELKPWPSLETFPIEMVDTRSRNSDCNHNTVCSIHYRQHDRLFVNSATPNKKGAEYIYLLKRRAIAEFVLHFESQHETTTCRRHLSAGRCSMSCTLLHAKGLNCLGGVVQTRLS